MYQLKFNNVVLHQCAEPITVNDKEDCYEAGTYRCYSPAPSEPANVQIIEVADMPTLGELKAQRAAAVAAIKVTTQAGNTFDGDETSINRITAAITVLKATGGTVPWVLADNSIVICTEAELTEALALAAAEVARLWVAPYVP
jgi:hypothetical protein